MLSLDSSAAIDLLRSRTDRQVRERMEAAIVDGRQIWVSSVVVHELMTGALASRRPVHQMQRLDDLVERFDVAEFTADDGIGAARVRADLERMGRGIGALDMLIAGQALARGWTLVTRDLKHFLRVDGLTIIDWTQSDLPVDRAAILNQMGRQRPEEDK